MARIALVPLDGDRGTFAIGTRGRAFTVTLHLDDGPQCPDQCAVRIRAGPHWFTGTWGGYLLEIEGQTGFMNAIQEAAETQFRVSVQGVDHFYTSPNAGFGSAYVWILTEGSMVLKPIEPPDP